MTALLTPEQIAEMREIDALYSIADTARIPCVKHRRELLRNQEAIARELDEIKRSLTAAGIIIQRQDMRVMAWNSVDGWVSSADERLRALVTAIRGEK